MQLDAVRVACEPRATLSVEPVAGTVVQDEKQLSSPIASEKEVEEEMGRVPVEDGRARIGEWRVVRATAPNTRLDVAALADLMRSRVEPRRAGSTDEALRPSS
jgi:hypothetical protein